MTGMYYTPKEIQKIADPSTGTGVFLKDATDYLLANPPYAAEQSVQWTLATVWQKLVALFRRQSH